MTNQLPNDLSHLSDAEFYLLCPQGEHAPGPEPLSHAAQAVMDAYWQAPLSNEASVAAALRAAADQWKNEIRKQPSTEFISGIKNCIDALNELADKLEALPND
jgi:hypothetical protein